MRLAASDFVRCGRRTTGDTARTVRSEISSARLYWENELAFFDVKNVTIPVAVSAFPDELFQSPRSWAERAFPKLIHYNKLDQGGQFAAWEQPELLCGELRTAFRSLRDKS